MKLKRDEIFAVLVLFGWLAWKIPPTFNPAGSTSGVVPVSLAVARDGIIVLNRAEGPIQEGEVEISWHGDLWLSKFDDLERYEGEGLPFSEFVNENGAHLPAQLENPRNIEVSCDPFESYIYQDVDQERAVAVHTDALMDEFWPGITKDAAEDSSGIR